MAFRQPFQRGALGFELTAPAEVELKSTGTGVKGAERRGGKVVGEIAISPFRAGLIIDRDGVLADKARDAAESIARHAAAGRVIEPVAVRLRGAAGYRASVELPRGAPLPYAHAFALADDAGVDGGLLLIVKSAEPDWAAADALLGSMRLINRSGVVQANDDDAPARRLPLPGA